MVAFAPLAEPSALRLAGWPEQSRRLPASPGVWSLRYIDAPICRDEDKNSDGDCTDSDDEHLYYTTDANFNVTALTDKNGDEVERYLYDPYGVVTFLKADWSLQEVSGHADGTASAYDNPILFAGYYRDSETGLYHVRNRMYHPNLGLWLQRDPLGYVDGMSLYEYCASRPIVSRDPYGDILRIRASSSPALRRAVRHLQKLHPGVKVKGSEVTTEKLKPKERAKGIDPDLVEKLVQSSNVHTINVTSKGTSRSKPTNERAAMDGKPGSGSTITYNPYNEQKVPTMQEDGSVKMQKTPPPGVLGHECIHSSHYDEGTHNTKVIEYTDRTGVTRSDSAEEVRTGGYTTSDPAGQARPGESTEAKQRERMQIGQRAYHNK